MAVYRPTKDSKVWWYDFEFSGQRIRESTKTRSKTLAIDAERVRRRELEQAYNGVRRRDKAKLFTIAAEEWMTLKKLTLAPSSIRIETDNLKHILPQLGKKLVADIDAKDVSRYQQARLLEEASPKTINLETGTIRAILRRNKVWANIQQDVRMLPVRDDIGHAISHEEEDALLAACLQSRSRSLYPAVMLALNSGMRYSEIRLLQWKQINLATKTLTVGKSKTTTGTGRSIFLNARVAPVLAMWAEQFPKRQPTHFLFPFEKYGAAGDEFKPCVYDQHPDRPVGDWKEAWEAAKRRTGRQCPSCTTGKLGEAETARGKNKEYICCDCGSTTNELPAEVKCRFHDLRHTAVTRMLEAGVPYSVVATVMGWSAATAIRMAKRYGHIGQKSLQDAMATLERQQIAAESPKNPPKSANEFSQRLQ